MNQRAKVYSSWVTLGIVRSSLYDKKHELFLFRRHHLPTRKPTTGPSSKTAEIRANLCGFFATRIEIEYYYHIILQIHVNPSLGTSSLSIPPCLTRAYSPFRVQFVSTVHVSPRTPSVSGQVGPALPRLTKRTQGPH